MQSQIGSEEHTPEQFAEMNAAHDRMTQDLEAAAQTSAEARAFMNTALGRAIRKTISTNKLITLELCATSKDETLERAQFDYKVWETVGQVFSQIIVSGEEALLELTLKGSDE